jgi:hypothetical protein
MTALKEYARLESMGVWRESPATQRRDVFVAFGDSTLVISDRNDTALAHWSLAAVERVNPGGSPATYAPGGDATETLEIEDEMMVAAIEKVRTLISRRRPQPGRLRVWLVAGFFAAVVGLLVFWLPGALLRHTVSVLPPASLTGVGQTLLSEMERVTGQPCRTERGAAALDRLAARVLGPGNGEIIVLREGVRTTRHLPGGIFLVNSGVIEDHETPEVVAGYLLAEAERRARTDPMATLLRAAGPRATLSLLTTGDLPHGSLGAYAEQLLVAPDEQPPTDNLLARFAAARVPSTPYAFALDVTGETSVALIEADPMAGGGGLPVLSDAEWVALQGICSE